MSLFRRPFPPSEYRRVHMIKMVRELAAMDGITQREARTTARRMIQYLEAKVHAGEEINLGFAKIIPRKVKPMEIPMNFDKGGNRRFFKGESVRWVIRIIGSWAATHSPHWRGH